LLTSGAMKILKVQSCKHPHEFPVTMSSSNQWLSEPFLLGFSDMWKANQYTTPNQYMSPNHYTSPNHKCPLLP